MGLYAPPALKLSPGFSWPHEHCQLLPLPVLGHLHPHLGWILSGTQKGEARSTAGLAE